VRCSRFHEEQIVRLLEHEASGLPVSSFMKRRGITRKERQRPGVYFVRRVRRWRSRAGSQPPTSIRGGRGRTMWGRASTAGWFDLVNSQATTIMDAADGCETAGSR
jgi:hypothetical protein